MSKWLYQSDSGNKNYTTNDTEFGKLFNCDKIPSQDNLYKWTIKKDVLNNIDRAYIQLYLFKSNLDDLASLVVGNGLVTKDGKVNETLNKFKQSLGMSDISFFNEVLRLRQTKGNLAITLTTIQNPITGQKEYRFVIIPPEKLAIVTKTNEDNYGLATMEYFGVTNGKQVDQLEWESSILIRNQTGTIFGLPPLIINNAMTQGIINDIQKYNLSHANGGQKAQLVSYTSPDKDTRIVSGDDLKAQNESLKRMLNSNQKVIATNLEAKVITLEEAKESDQFYNHISETYPFYSAKLAGISPSMAINPKNINRATASQEYKAMIQKTVLPLNSTLSQVAQKMMDIWLVYTNNPNNVEIKLSQPKEDLDVGLDPTNIWQLVDKKIITINEARKMLNLAEIN
jgi:hypothetical protein